MIDILIPVLLALVGWKLASLIHIPAPKMIGPMLLIAVASVLWGVQVQLHPMLRIVIQSLIGGYIGRRINLKTIHALVKLLPAIIMTTIWYGLATAGIGYGVARLACIDLGSAFLASAPGGVAEMTALAMVSAVDVAFVATLQTLRVVASNIMIPIIAKFAPVPKDGEATQRSRSDTPKEDDPRKVWLKLHWIGTILVGLFGSFLFTGLNIPAGGMLGAMTAIALLQIRRFSIEPVPKILLTGTYMILGISVGSSFDLATLKRLQGSLGLLIGATIATLISSIILSFVVKRMMHIDIKTSLLACSPGGLSIMAVVAEETGARVEVVSLLHLVRLIWVVISMPIFMSIFL